MLKHAALVLSLLLNAVLIVWFVIPPKPSGIRMTCEEARSDVLNKRATAGFALKNNGSLAATHDFLRASDYELRNIASMNGQVTFVYVAVTYPQTCGFHFPGIDGSVVPVQADLSVFPSVNGVN
ncbi:MAG: hypothetical protein ACK4L4_13230 [Gemmobacter sp.]